MKVLSHKEKRDLRITTHDAFRRAKELRTIYAVLVREIHGTTIFSFNCCPMDVTGDRVAEGGAIVGLVDPDGRYVAAE